jgi:DNA-directed RNA polymerase II subunit RPB9
MKNCDGGRGEFSVVHCRVWDGLVRLENDTATEWLGHGKARVRRRVRGMTQPREASVLAASSHWLVSDRSAIWPITAVLVQRVLTDQSQRTSRSLPHRDSPKSLASSHPRASYDEPLNTVCLLAWDTSHKLLYFSPVYSPLSYLYPLLHTHILVHLPRNSHQHIKSSSNTTWNPVPRLAVTSPRKSPSSSVANGIYSSKSWNLANLYSSNMLYPKEDPERKELSFACRTCAYHEEPTSACIYRNDLTNSVGETAGITQDVGQDPTVGHPSSSSPNARAAFVENESMEPCTCTVCGQEILCETCGRPTAMGCWLEVNDDDEHETYVASLVHSLSQLSTRNAPPATSDHALGPVTDDLFLPDDFEHEYITESDPMSEDDYGYYSEFNPQPTGETGYHLSG